MPDFDIEHVVVHRTGCRLLSELSMGKVKKKKRQKKRPLFSYYVKTQHSKKPWEYATLYTHTLFFLITQTEYIIVDDLVCGLGANMD